MYSMRLSWGNEANPRIGNAAKVTALFAVALLALPAFAETARYVGSHTADSARFTDLFDLPFEHGLFGNMMAEYTGDSIIFTADGGAGYMWLPDEEGEIRLDREVNWGRSDFSFTMVVESVTLPDWNDDPILFGMMNLFSPGQYWYFANDGGTYVFVYSTEDLLVGFVPPASTTPVTFPVTVTFERSDLDITYSVVDAGGAVLDQGGNTMTVDLDFMAPRIVLFDAWPPGEGASLPGESSMTVSLIETSGVVLDIVLDRAAGVADTNVPAVSSITRTGAIDEPFTSGTAEWEVTFKETVKNVTGDDFTRVLSGNATGDQPTVAELSGSFGRVYIVTVANVGGTATIGLNFNDGTDVATIIGDIPIGGETGEAYTAVAAQVPAVGILGWGLAAGVIAVLGASAARRRRN